MVGSLGMPIRVLCSSRPGISAWYIAFFRWVMQSISKTGSWRSKSRVSVRSTNGPSRSRFLVSRPSNTNSESAGTSRFLVTHFVKGVGSSACAIENSSTPGGGPRDAAIMTATEFPTQTAISRSSSSLS